MRVCVCVCVRDFKARKYMFALSSGAVKIHRLHLCSGVRPQPTSVLDIKLNNLIGGTSNERA